MQNTYPSGIIATKGFVVGAGGNQAVSKEQDILIIDVRNEAPIFFENDLVITFPHLVIAAVSVKTKFSKSTISSSIRGLNTVLNIVDLMPNHTPFCSAFIFVDDPSLFVNPNIFFTWLNEELKDIQTALNSSHNLNFPRVIVGIEEFYCSCDLREDNFSSIKISLYRTHGLSSALFLTELLNHITFYLSGGRSGFSEIASMVDLELIETFEYIINN